MSTRLTFPDVLTHTHLWNDETQHGFFVASATMALQVRAGPARIILMHRSCHFRRGAGCSLNLAIKRVIESGRVQEIQGLTLKNIVGKINYWGGISRVSAG